MLKEKIVHVFCGPRDSFWQSTEESIGMGDDEEINTRSFG